MADAFAPRLAVLLVEDEPLQLMERCGRAARCRVRGRRGLDRRGGTSASGSPSRTRGHGRGRRLGRRAFKRLHAGQGRGGALARGRDPDRIGSGVAGRGADARGRALPAQAVRARGARRGSPSHAGGAGDRLVSRPPAPSAGSVRQDGHKRERCGEDKGASHDGGDQQHGRPWVPNRYAPQCPRAILSCHSVVHSRPLLAALIERGRGTGPSVADVAIASVVAGFQQPFEQMDLYDLPLHPHRACAGASCDAAPILRTARAPAGPAHRPTAPALARPVWLHSLTSIGRSAPPRSAHGAGERPISPAVGPIRNAAHQHDARVQLARRHQGRLHTVLE